MKRRNCQILSFLIVLILLLGLCGCSSSDIPANRIDPADRATQEPVANGDISAEKQEELEEEEELVMGNTTTILVDFSRREGVPLLKKFGLFNSGIVALSHYERDAYLMDPLRTDSLRVDIYMGSDGLPFAHLVDGTETDMIYNFEDLDALVRLLEEHDIRPYWSWSYIPFPLQQDKNWRKGPSSLEQWQTMFKEFATHYKKEGLRIAYNEVYNEPDCNGVFFLGTMEDYIELYIRAVKGLKEGNPDAVVGGPSTAFIENSGAEIKNFLDEVLEEDVPLDFFSYHSYGYDTNQYITRTRQAREILSQYVDFDTTELHLNEYNSLIQPFLADGPAEHSLGGATMLTSFEQLLDETDVTLAHWAQFLDTGYEPLGSVDVLGRVKAPYWAYWMYSQMPEERVHVEGLLEISQRGVHAMASSDEGSAGVLVWNDGEQTYDVEVELLNCPADFSTCEVYEMNDEIDPYWNTNGEIRIEPQSTLNMRETENKISVEIPAGGFAFYHMSGGDASVEEKETVGNMIRKHYYFPERAKSSYSFYDETDQIVYLGMNGEYSARAVVATELEGLPDIVQLSCQSGGHYEEIDFNTSFSVRVDYAVGEEYTKAVLYTFMPINQRRNSVVPWGTKKEADQVIPCETLFTGKSWLMLEANAPEGWMGRAIITYDMHSTGADTWAELCLDVPEAGGSVE